MTLQELEHIFRFQTTADAEYTPKDILEYLLISGENRISGTCPAKDLSVLLTKLNDNEYVFEGYRDRTPIFIIPETPIVL
jgi:hypothetical protein